MYKVSEDNHGVYECVGIENGETKRVRFEFVLNRKFIIFCFILNNH